MHPVADKVKLKQFEGEIDIMGRSRSVAFVAEYGDQGAPGYEPAVLTIAGLSMSEAWEALSRLAGPVAVPSEAKKSETKAAPAEPKKTEAKAAAPPPKKEEPKPAVVKEPAPDDLDDLGDGEKGQALDVDFMAKQEKLRPVIEHMIACGHKTAIDIVRVASGHKGAVPTLKALEEKGGFDKRIERAALVVLGGEAAS